VMTVSEVADYLGLPASTVRRLAREGSIPAFKVGRQWRVKRELLKRSLERGPVHDACGSDPAAYAEEPERLRRGKAFHREVQREWCEEAEGEVTAEASVIKPDGSRGRADVLVDAGSDLVAVVEIKASDWDRMSPSAVRANVTRQAQQIWDYIESQLADGKEVSPGVVFPKLPESRKRLRLIEDLFDEEGISVVWQDETIEERRARADDVP
jgi:excisionase family DNA binding protein